MNQQKSDRLKYFNTALNSLESQENGINDGKVNISQLSELRSSLSSEQETLNEAAQQSIASSKKGTNMVTNDGVDEDNHNHHHNHNDDNNEDGEVEIVVNEEDRKTFKAIQNHNNGESWAALKLYIHLTSEAEKNVTIFRNLKDCITK